MSAAWPIVKKVLIQLGIGVVSYEALSVLGNQVVQLVQSYWAGLPTVVLQILSITGFSEAVGITLAALVARISFVAVGKIGRVAA